MSLIIRPPNFTRLTTNMSETPHYSTGTPGANVVPGASNSLGTALELLPALAHDVEYVELLVGNFNSNAANGHVLANILIDPAGGTSYTETLIPNLMIGKTESLGTITGIAQHYHFPLFIPRGASIACNAQTALATAMTDGYVIINAWGGNSNPGSWWSGRKVTAIGPSAATSQAQSVAMDTSWGSWTDLGSPITEPCGALQFVAGCRQSGTADVSSLNYFEFGIGGVRVGPRLVKQTRVSEEGWNVPTGPIFCSAPAGTQFQVRTRCEVASSNQSVGMYAVH